MSSSFERRARSSALGFCLANPDAAVFSGHRTHAIILLRVAVHLNC